MEVELFRIESKKPEGTGSVIHVSEHEATIELDEAIPRINLLDFAVSVKIVPPA